MTTAPVRLRRLDVAAGRRLAVQLLLVLAGLAGAWGAGWLVGYGAWYMVLTLGLAVPVFTALHRYPLAMVGVWVALTPLLAVTDSGAIRRAFWLLHRGLPLIALIVVIVGSLVGLRPRPTAKLGWAEILAIGYLFATTLSLMYTGVDVGLSATHIYDRIFIPIMLYLLVRLLQPDADALRKLVPILLFVLGVQVIVGVISWTVPGVLPSAWLNNVGLRTVGTLNETNLFGVTALGSGLLLLHSATADDRWSRIQRLALFGAATIGLFAAFFTFSRAVWFALFLTVLGLVALYPKFVRQLFMVALVVLAVTFQLGLLQGPIEYAQDRFRSEQADESALSRLPVMLASLRMFQDRPAFGFGYENFDRYDLYYQSRVGDLYYPDKDHASHNVFLTILAEQGLIGIVLFLGPLAYWAARSNAARRRLPRDGLVSSKLLALMWLFVLGQFVVHNFSRLQVSYGFGLWWLSLGLIGSIVARSVPNGDQRRTAAGRSSLPSANSMPRQRLLPPANPGPAATWRRPQPLATVQPAVAMAFSAVLLTVIAVALVWVLVPEPGRGLALGAIPIASGWTLWLMITRGVGGTHHTGATSDLSTPRTGVKTESPIDHLYEKLDRIRQSLRHQAIYAEPRQDRDEPEHMSDAGRQR